MWLQAGSSAASAARELTWWDLTSPAWTGVAAIAQGVAAVGALFAVFILVAQLRATQHQLQATQAQLQLDREQAEAARQRSRPHLQLQVLSPQMAGTQVRIRYASGNEPADVVQAWVSVMTGRPGPFRQGNRSLLAMTRDQSQQTLYLALLTPDQLKEGPFDDVESKITLSSNEWWAAVTWLAPDGSQGRWGYVHRNDAAASENLIWGE